MPSNRIDERIVEALERMAAAQVRSADAIVEILAYMELVTTALDGKPRRGAIRVRKVGMGA